MTDNEESMICSACDQSIPLDLHWDWCAEIDCLQPVCFKCKTAKWCGVCNSWPYEGLEEDEVRELCDQCKSEEVVDCCKEHQEIERYMDTLPPFEGAEHEYDVYADTFSPKTFIEFRIK